MTRLVLSVTAFLVLADRFPAAAQMPLAVGGQVTDETGAALPGTSIELRERDSSLFIGAGVADSAGRYRISVPRPARHQIRFALISSGELDSLPSCRCRGASRKRWRATARWSPQVWFTHSAVA